MADLVANNSAKAAVRAFLNLGSDSSDSESDVAPEDLKARPTGLGLGAKFAPHAPKVATEAERRLAGALRKQSNVDQENSSLGKGRAAGADSDGSSEEKESRAKVVGKRKRKKRALSKVGTDSKKTETVANENHTPKNEDAEKSPKLLQGKKSTSSLAASEKSPNDGQLGVEASEVSRSGSFGHHQKTDGKVQSGANGQPWVPRKRKKIRSRQKNLRRDKRPKDKLPSHLTEETLRGGRVKRVDTVITQKPGTFAAQKPHAVPTQDVTVAQQPET